MKYNFCNAKTIIFSKIMCFSFEYDIHFWSNYLHEFFVIFYRIEFLSLSIKFSYEIFSTWHLMDNVFMWNVWLSFSTKGILNKETMPWWFQKGPSTVITSHFLEYIEINVGHKCFISFPQTKVLWGNV